MYSWTISESKKKSKRKLKTLSCGTQKWKHKKNYKMLTNSSSKNEVSYNKCLHQEKEKSQIATKLHTSKN
jgi:hypothetical protein